MSDTPGAGALAAIEGSPLALAMRHELWLYPAVEIVHIGGVTIGRATYEPGWRWSVDVGPSVGAERCVVEHVGLVLEGTATAALEGGRVIELHAGELFHIPTIPHDSWVVGDERYVSLHFLGAERYAR